MPKNYMNCKKCNNLIDNDVVFCRKCGNKNESDLSLEKKSSKQNLYTALIIVTSLVYLAVTIATDSDIFSGLSTGEIIAVSVGMLLGTCVFPGLFAALYYKFASKKKTSEEKFETATIIYCVIIGLLIIGQFSI